MQGFSFRHDLNPSEYGQIFNALIIDDLIKHICVVCRSRVKPVCLDNGLYHVFEVFPGVIPAVKHLALEDAKETGHFEFVLVSFNASNLGKIENVLNRDVPENGNLCAVVEIDKIRVFTHDNRFANIACHFCPQKGR